LETSITPTNFRRAARRWSDPKEHAQYLAPFFAVHEAERSRAGYEPGQVWAWDDDKAVGKCLELVWQLAGKWGALRGPVPVRRDAFDAAVTRSVPALARELNRLRVRDLSQLGDMSGSNYNATAAREAWTKTTAWFDKYLKS